MVDKMLPANVIKINRNWFKTQLQTLNMSQRELGRRLGLNPAAIVLSMQGKRRFKAEELAEMSRIFGEPMEEIMRHLGIESHGVSEQISLEGVVTAGGIVVPASHNKTIPAPHLAESLKVLRFETKGTDYEFLHGWVIFYQPSPDTINPEAVGQLSVVRTNGNPSAIIRVIRRGLTSGRWDLYQHPNSPDPSESNVIVTSAAPIRWIKPN